MYRETQAARLNFNLEAANNSGAEEISIQALQRLAVIGLLCAQVLGRQQHAVIEPCPCQGIVLAQFRFAFGFGLIDHELASSVSFGSASRVRNHWEIDVSTTCGSGWVNLGIQKFIGISHAHHPPTRYRRWY
jgi:hypothetical protein